MFSDDLTTSKANKLALPEDKLGNSSSGEKKAAKQEENSNSWWMENNGNWKVGDWETNLPVVGQIDNFHKGRRQLRQRWANLTVC